MSRVESAPGDGACTTTNPAELAPESEVRESAPAGDGEGSPAGGRGGYAGSQVRILLSKSNQDLASNGARACENAGAHEAVPETQDDIEECSSDSSDAHAHAGGATSAEGAGLDDLGDGMDMTYLHGDQYRRMQLSATILLDSLPPGAGAALDAPEGWRNGRSSELDLREWVGGGAWVGSLAPEIKDLKAYIV